MGYSCPQDICYALSNIRDRPDLSESTDDNVGPGTYDENLGPVMLVGQRKVTVLDICAHNQYGQVGTTRWLER